MNEFVTFALSKEGQDVVTDVGFVSQNIYTVRPGRLTTAPPEYLAVAENAERLSLNFRFRTSSDELDNKAVRDFDRFIGFLAQNPSRDIYLFGFTDNVGTPDPAPPCPARNTVSKRQLNQRKPIKVGIVGTGDPC